MIIIQQYMVGAEEYIMTTSHNHHGGINLTYGSETDEGIDPPLFSVCMKLQ